MTCNIEFCQCFDVVMLRLVGCPLKFAMFLLCGCCAVRRECCLYVTWHTAALKRTWQISLQHTVFDNLSSNSGITRYDALLPLLLLLVLFKFNHLFEVGRIFELAA